MNLAIIAKAGNRLNPQQRFDLSWVFLCICKDYPEFRVALVGRVQRKKAKRHPRSFSQPSYVSPYQSNKNRHERSSKMKIISREVKTTGEKVTQRRNPLYRM